MVSSVTARSRCTPRYCRSHVAPIRLSTSQASRAASCVVPVMPDGWFRVVPLTFVVYVACSVCVNARRTCRRRREAPYAFPVHVSQRYWRTQALSASLCIIHATHRHSCSALGTTVLFVGQCRIFKVGLALLNTNVGALFMRQFLQFSDDLLWLSLRNHYCVNNFINIS